MNPCCGVKEQVLLVLLQLSALELQQHPLDQLDINLQSDQLGW